jgi:hypothetical protein
MVQAEHAAILIQSKFRKNHPSDPAEEDDEVVTENDGTDSEEEEEEEKDRSELYTMIFMGLVSMAGMLSKIMKNCKGNDETDGLEAAQNIPTSTPGGGNGAAPGPPGPPP